MRTAGSWEHALALNAITTSVAQDYGEFSSLPAAPPALLLASAAGFQCSSQDESGAKTTP